MLKVNDLQVYYGVINAIKGVSFEVNEGEVIALINYMSQILVELVKLANLIITITKALACADRVAGVFEIKNEDVSALCEAYAAQKGEQTGEVPFLQFDHVSLTYAAAGAETLHDMNFTVNRGETVGIIGGTGFGKSSLVNLIPGFYPATQGAVLLEGEDIRKIPVDRLRVDGRDVKDYDLVALRDKIGVVMQKAVLFQGTIEENLRWGNSDATEEELWAAIDTAQAREVVEGKPGKLDAEISQNGKNLSGGQRQRLTIARALVRKPEILILDDSASALDYATDAKLREALKKLEGNTTTFIVSQRASTIRHADKIIVLDDGEMAGIGTHDELLKSSEVYKEIYYSQYPEERLKAEKAEYAQK